MNALKIDLIAALQILLVVFVFYTYIPIKVRHLKMLLFMKIVLVLIKAIYQNCS